jgi:hypothetical protein
MRAKNGLPRRRCGAVAMTAGPAGTWPAGGDAMPRAGAVSHRQQIIRIANNIEEFSPWSVHERHARGLVFRVCVSKSRLAAARLAIASIWLAICAHMASVASTWPASRWQCVD